MKTFMFVLLFNTYSTDDTVLLAKIITSECSICSYTEKQLVASTVLNRVDDMDFPDSILGVIKAKGQYLGYKSKWFILTKESLKVAKEVMEGVGRDYEILYFYGRESYDTKFVESQKSNIKYPYFKYHLYGT